MSRNRRVAADAQAACAKSLFAAYCSALQEDRGVRAEDVICVAASIVGERCIEAAGDFDPRKHDFVPGQRVFSDRVNAILCGDHAGVAFADVPGGTVFGTLRDVLTHRGYAVAEFPSLESIFRGFAAATVRAEEWGTVPLSVPAPHRPRVMPLRVAYEWRRKVDAMLEPVASDVSVRMTTTVLALAETLAAVAGAIDHRLALTLALETVNGMSKTAPMTDAAMAKAQQEAPRTRPGS